MTSGEILTNEEQDYITKRDDSSGSFGGTGLVANRKDCKFNFSAEKQDENVDVKIKAYLFDLHTLT